MRDFFTSLALRSLGSAEIVQPRLPALFEPPQPVGSLASEPGIPPQATNQEPLEEIGLEGDAQMMPTTKRAANAFLHEPPLRTAEESQPRFSSILRLAQNVAASNAVLPGSNQEERAAIGPETVVEQPGTISRTAAVRVEPLRIESSNVGTAEPGSSRVFRPVVSRPLSRVHPQSNGVEGMAIRFNRMTLDAAGGERLLRDAEGLPATATETRDRLAKTERDLPLPPVDYDRPTTATRAQARYWPAEHSPSTGTLIAPSRVVPHDQIFAPAAPSPRRDSSEPAIQVTIGRIEVRALSQPAPAPRERSGSQVMPLEEYLRRRSRRGAE